MRSEPKPFQVYRHFKGTYYQVLSVAIHSETREKLVIYRPLFGGDEVYARPLDMFLSDVDHEKSPLVKQKWRFSLATGQIKKNDAKEAPVKEAPAEEVQAEEAAVEEAVVEEPPVEETPLEEVTTSEEEPEEAPSEDFLDRFLDADSYEKKLEVFTDMWKTVEEDDVDNVATVMDIELKGETLEEKYKEILKCLKMRAKYECTRLR